MFQDVAEPAAEALVNLSQNPEIVEKMVRMGMVKSAMEMLYKQDSEIKQLLVMLLLNLTQLDAGIDSLLQVPSLLSYSISSAFSKYGLDNVNTLYMYLCKQ